MLKDLLWSFVPVQNLNLLSLGISVSALKGKLGILKLQHGPKPFKSAGEEEKGSPFGDTADAM